jgi:hypothetical protein
VARRNVSPANARWPGSNYTSRSAGRRILRTSGTEAYGRVDGAEGAKAEEDFEYLHHAGAFALLGACVGRLDYVRPVTVETPVHWLVVAKGRVEGVEAGAREPHPGSLRD